MRVFLMTDHQYPAYGPTGTGLHSRQFPSGSAYHLHDLLARGLAEEGHDVFYRPEEGAGMPLPPGVHLVTETIPEFDICHSPEGPPGLAQSATAVAVGRGAPYLLTCHMAKAGAVAKPTWAA